MPAPPLSGVRVADLGQGLTGPLLGMHLADLGADVVRLEPPWGDEWRDIERVPGHPGRSRQHLQLGRGKRALAADLGRPGGREVARRLAGWADVLVVNMRPGVPERLGLGYAACAALNPRLVYCAISGFGEAGPLAGRGGYDLVAQARAGLLPGGPDAPRVPPAPFTDTAAPLLGLAAVLAALYERERSGLGQRVEASLLGAAAALNAHALVRLDDAPPAASCFSWAFSRPYRTRDGWIALAAHAERLARRACVVLGLPGLLDEPALRDRADRAARDDEVAARLAERFRTRTTADWDADLAAAGVPAGPVRARDALMDDEQALAAGLVARAEDPELGTVTGPAPAVRLGRTPGRAGVPGRRLGEDSEAVLRELGYTAAEVARLAADGVVVLG